MRKLISLVLILALPTMAFAATDISATSGGLASLEFVIGSAPASIPLELVISTDRAGNGVNGIWSADGGIMGPAGLAVTALSIKTGWGYTAGSFTVPSPLDGVQAFGGYDLNATSANAIVAPGGTLASGTVGGIDTLAVGTYTIYVVDSPSHDPISGRGVWTTGFGDTFAFDSSNALTIKIADVPEPATMLLLAGALPFLRRRSA